MFPSFNPGKKINFTAQIGGTNGDHRRNSDGAFETSDKLSSAVGPLQFLKETFKTRRQRKLAKRYGVSTNPSKERLFLTGYHGNWVMSWCRSHRKWRHLRTSVTGSDEEISSRDFRCGVTSEPREVTEPDVFYKSTGNIKDDSGKNQQGDDFVFINYVITPKKKTYDVTGRQILDVIDPHWFIATATWRANLSFCGFTVGDATVSFSSLFPTSEYMTSLVMDAVVLRNFREVVHQMALLALRCGLLRPLRTILELGLIDVQHEFPGGMNMLHVACISQNFDTCLFLCTVGTRRRTRDRKGRSPHSVCRSEKIRKLFPGPHHRYKTSSDWPEPTSNNLQLTRAKHAEEIFTLAETEKQQDELQALLQSFNLNTKDLVNSEGDFLIHVITKKGLPYLSSLLNLIRLQGHDLEKRNSQGMTSLMIAASDGNDVICDVLICVLGADPNAHNKRTGFTALHYAADKGHLNVVCTLLKRGVDPNAETLRSMRADDLARLKPDTDCMDAIRAAQQNRRKELTRVAREERLGSRLLYETDLTVTDQLGDILLMTAARHNKVDNIHILLSRKSYVIDAQNAQSGKTSLSIAASLGHADTVDALLCAGANPLVRDISGNLALHHGVMSGHVTVVETLLERSSSWHGLDQALKLSPSPTITRILKEAHNKRQEMLVCPALLEGAITGNVDLLFDILEAGDNVNPISGDGNWPALVASAGGHLEALTFLEQNGGNIWGRHEVTKNTLLHVACANGHDIIADFLLGHYGNKGDAARRKMINSYNTFHKVALQLAADNGYTRTVRLLLHHGASTSLLDDHGDLYNCSSFQGIQLLIQQARLRHVNDVISAIKHAHAPLEHLQEVYESSTDHNLRNTQGDGPLQVACHHGNPKVVRFLLQAFPDPSLRLQEVSRPNPRDGATSMHRALQGGDHVTVVRLLAAEDKTLVNAHDHSGQTPLHLACLLNRHDAAEKLTGMPNIDVNATDVNNHKPDDVTNHSSLRHKIRAARRRQGETVPRTYDAVPSTPTIDFDDLNRRFQSVKNLQRLSNSDVSGEF